MDMVERLLQDPRVDPSVWDNAPVLFAAEGGHFAVVDRLLEDDLVDVNVAIENTRIEERKRYEYRERLTEIYRTARFRITGLGYYQDSQRGSSVVDTTAT